MKNVWLTYLHLFLCFTTQAREVFIPTEEMSVKSGSNYIEYYLTKDTINDPLARYKSMQSGINPEKVKKYLFVTTKSQKWLYFEAQNQLKMPFDLLIEMGNFGLNDVDYYVFSQQTLIDSGNISRKKGFYSGKFYDKNIVIPFQLEPEKKYEFLIKVRTNAPLLGLPVIFWNKSAKLSKAQSIELGRGIFYGVLFYFVSISGIVMLLVRNQNFFNYWMYISLGGALLFMKSGISLEILWPNSVYFDFALRNFLLYAYLIFTLQFMKEFLRNRMELGISLRILNGLIFAGIALGVSYFVLSFLFKEWVDALLIIQTVYTNITNVVVTILFIYSFSKIRERLLLSVFFAYYLTFSLYLFNPFLEFGFWIGNSLAFVIIYSGGIFIAMLLVVITALRTRNVFDNNRDMKRELGTLNRSYTYSLLEGQEKERKRVAEELHDGIGVLMSTIKMKLSLLSDKIPSENKEALTAILNNVDESCQHIRELSHELMPPALVRYGLTPALTDMLQEYERNYPVQLSLKTNVGQVKMTSVSHIALYRLVHYLLEAVVHSQCKRAELKLFVFPSVSNATLRIEYSGGYMHPKQEEYKKLKELINLFQGRMDNFMSNIWDDELEIEIPVVMIEDEKQEITS